MTELKTAERDGVRLCYSDTGSGDPPILFIHGWCCSHDYWRQQVPGFAGSHRVVAVDLRGHGQSDAPEGAYTIDSFVDDVAWLMQSIGLERPVVVGHSMGGLITLGLATTRPELLRSAVLVDAPAVFFSSPPPGIAQFVESLRGPGYRESATAFVERMFRPYSDPELKSWVCGAMVSAPQHVMASAMECMTAGTGKLPTGELAVPCLSIVADGDVRASAAAWRELYPNITTAQVAGSGHFVQLEVPDQFNAMLRRFLEVTA